MASQIEQSGEAQQEERPRGEASRQFRQPRTEREPGWLKGRAGRARELRFLRGLLIFLGVALVGMFLYVYGPGLYTNQVRPYLNQKAVVTSPPTLQTTTTKTETTVESNTKAKGADTTQGKDPAAFATATVARGEIPSDAVPLHGGDVAVHYDGSALYYYYTASGKYERQITGKEGAACDCRALAEEIPSSEGDRYFLIVEAVQRSTPATFEVWIKEPGKPEDKAWEWVRFTKPSGS